MITQRQIEILKQRDAIKGTEQLIANLGEYASKAFAQIVERTEESNGVGRPATKDADLLRAYLSVVEATMNAPQANQSFVFELLAVMPELCNGLSIMSKRNWTEYYFSARDWLETEDGALSDFFFLAKYELFKANKFGKFITESRNARSLKNPDSMAVHNREKDGATAFVTAEIRQARVKMKSEPDDDKWPVYLENMLLLRKDIKKGEMF